MQELIKFAKSDIRAAKKSGSMIVSQTKVGNVHISYNGETFGMVAQKSLSTVDLGNYTAKEAAEKLATLYEVEV